MYPRILGMVCNQAKTLGYCRIEFEERGKHIWAFIRCWDNSHFRRVYVSILDFFSSNVNEEVVVLGRVTDALGPNVCLVSVHGGPHVPMEAYVSYLGSGYQQKQTEYTLFDLRLFKRCLQWTVWSVFGTLEPYSLTEFIVNRFKMAESCDWRASRPALEKSIISSKLGMPEHVDVAVNMMGVWPLIVSYLKETGQKDDEESLLVCSLSLSLFLSLFDFDCQCFVPMYIVNVMFRRKGWIGTSI